MTSAMPPVLSGSTARPRWGKPPSHGRSRTVPFRTSIAATAPRWGPPVEPSPRRSVGRRKRSRTPASVADANCEYHSLPSR